MPLNAEGQSFASKMETKVGMETDEQRLIFRDIWTYYCEHCGICRSKKSLLRSHILSHHKNKDAEVLLKLGSTTDKREQYKLMRDAMEKRFIQVARGSIIDGVRLGMFTTTFYGLLNLLAHRRGIHDAFNVAGAGSATTAMFGLIMPGSMKWRARNVLLGSVLEAGICFPLGWLHIKLVEKANGHILQSDVTEATNTSAVGAAIERLERSLKK